MDANTSLIIVLIIFGVLLAIGVKIAIALSLAAIMGFFLFRGNADIAAYVPFDNLNSFLLTAIPLFIFMGEVLGQCGASEMIYRSASKWLAWVPGGLLHSNIATCAMFAAVSGSSPATAATVATVAVPRLRELGYDTSLVLGSLAAGGTLGILIPPSITMIVYALLSWTSVAALFAGGILPGIMLSVMFMTFIALRTAKNSKLAPRAPMPSLKELGLSLLDIWPLIVMAIVVLGGIFSGLMTPTEAAAIGSTTAIIIALLLRKFTWRKFWNCVTGAVKTTSMALFIMMGAFIFASFLGQTGVARNASLYVGSLGLPKIVILLFIYFLYILLGCFIDPCSMVVITLPTLLPILLDLDINLIWFGVVFVVLSEMAMVTPPVGVNLFIIQGISGEPIGKVVIGTIPFIFIMLVAILVLTAFPSIILWLPSLLEL